ncbi:MAG TPA: hypothetical protein VFW98_02305 [Gemmatimonadaceae bacterium]|nr:hypothetical protein [Gemmatimonadaceae bacterium]
MMIYVLGALAIAGAICVSVAPAGAQPTPANNHATTIYVAHLRALNTKVTGMRPSGEARFTITGDRLTIDVSMQHVPPDIPHLQHFHGFPNGKNATCATTAADTTHDGIVDLIETEPYSGTTMVPFTDDPVSMEIVTDTYPKASADGSYHYVKTVSLKALEAAFSKKYSGQQLYFIRRVVYVHGVPSSTELPTSVASLGTIPAQVTIPIACGKIAKRTK